MVIEMKVITIIITKLLILVGKIFDRGSTLPGKVAMKLQENILGKLKLPYNVIVVTGSSGKGSTTGIVTEILRNFKRTVIYNDNGGNVINGICTYLIKNATITGRIKADYVVLEVDERYCKYLFKYITPSHLLITNVTRDQPPRQGHFDIVFNDIIKELTDKTKLIVNADDPYLQQLKGDITYYGINKNKFTYKKSKFENLNYIYCPYCNSKLKYRYYQFENIGNYECPNCKFKRPIPDIKITNIDFDKKYIIINHEYKINTNTDLLYPIYNILGATTILYSLGYDLTKICLYISKLNGNKKLYDHFKIKKRNIYVLNNKAENATTFNQSLLFIDKEKKPITVVIGWKEISRRYLYNDLSWLYDIEFEILKNKKIEKIICMGPQRYDIAVRLKNACIDKNKIFEFSEVYEACEYIKNYTKKDIYAILNFDHVKPFIDDIKEVYND